VEDETLPTTVRITQAFAARMPSQRNLDALAKIEGTTFGQLAENQPSRLLAFRALQRDYPHRDVASLWLHAYDVEVELVEVDPTANGGPPTWQPSATTGVSVPPS